MKKTPLQKAREECEAVMEMWREYLQQKELAKLRLEVQRFKHILDEE